MRYRRLRIACLVSLCASACVSTQLSTVGPFRLQHPRIRSLAVVELADLTDNPHAGEIARAAIATELHNRYSLRVVEVTEELGTTARQPIDRSRAQALGRELHVDAVIYGTLLEYDYVRGGPRSRGRVPSISLNVRMVSTQTGAVLWAAGIVSTREQLWSYDNLPLEELMQRVSGTISTDLEPHLSAGGALLAVGPSEEQEAKPVESVQTIGDGDPGAP